MGKEQALTGGICPSLSGGGKASPSGESGSGCVKLGYAKPGKGTSSAKSQPFSKTGTQKACRIHVNSSKADGFTFRFTRDS